MKFIRKGGRVIPIKDNSSTKPKKSKFNKTAAIAAGISGAIGATVFMKMRDKKRAFKVAQAGSSAFWEGVEKSHAAGESTYSLFPNLNLGKK